MKIPRFPKPFAHDHPPVKNAQVLYEKQLTIGQRAADNVAAIAGSWPFVITQTSILAIWVALNVTALVAHWDPYPFILMNLVLSLQAAYTAPIIMMSQNRQAARDRIEAHNDFEVNLKTEQEVRLILEHLEAQNQVIEELHAAMKTLTNNNA